MISNTYVCPWRFLISHLTSNSCCLSKAIVDAQRTEKVVHVFNQTRYSIYPFDGTIFFQNIPMLENTVKVDSFALNNLKCRVITWYAFKQNDLVHLQTYVIETKIEFWNIIFNLKSMWVNNFHVKHEGERIWPLSHCIY